jgi:hypothetical protein
MPWNPEMSVKSRTYSRNRKKGKSFQMKHLAEEMKVLCEEMAAMGR